MHLISTHKHIKPSNMKHSVFPTEALTLRALCTAAGGADCTANADDLFVWPDIGAESMLLSCEQDTLRIDLFLLVSCKKGASTLS